jgi:hypothetical protein
MAWLWRRSGLVSNAKAQDFMEALLPKIIGS